MRFTLHWILRSVFILTLAAGGSLFAENRMYGSSTPVGQLIPAIIDALGRTGIQFSVNRVFNESRDGKQGFVFLLQPRQTICEITFFENRPGSIVKIFTQDSQDMNRFHVFFVETMRMRELGVTVPSGPTGNWPVPQ